MPKGEWWRIISRSVTLSYVPDGALARDPGRGFVYAVGYAMEATRSADGPRPGSGYGRAGHVARSSRRHDAHDYLEDELHRSPGDDRRRAVNFRPVQP